VSRSYNTDHAITGGLINTKRAFAQLLEGPAAAIDLLMSRILADARHETIRILRHGPISRRRVPIWTMAYSGRFGFVETRVEALVGADRPATQHRIDELADMIVQFAAQEGARC
jgi:hypothetical protein